MTVILFAKRAERALLDPSNQAVAAAPQTPFAHHADPADQVNLKPADAALNQATCRDA